MCYLNPAIMIIEDYRELSPNIEISKFHLPFSWSEKVTAADYIKLFKIIEPIFAEMLRLQLAISDEIVIDVFNHYASCCLSKDINKYNNPNCPTII